MSPIVVDASMWSFEIASALGLAEHRKHITQDGVSAFWRRFAESGITCRQANYAPRTRQEGAFRSVIRQLRKTTICQPAKHELAVCPSVYLKVSPRAGSAEDLCLPT